MTSPPSCLNMLCEPYLTLCSFTGNNIAHTIAHPIVRVNSYILITSPSWYTTGVVLQTHTRAMSKQHRIYLKGRNFRGKKISRISRILAKFAKINSFFDPRKCRFAKINSREIFQNWWFAKINSRKIFQEFMKCEYWSFCSFFFHLFP